MEQNSEISSEKELLFVQQQANKSVKTQGQPLCLEKLSRPMAFEKMENLVREMKNEANGVPVRHQKIFLTSIPYAFMGYDLIEWLMDRLSVEESEALNLANQLCLHGYFFPVNDTKNLIVKDDSSLYRFQSPYYWPWQHKTPDNIEYAIYLMKRSLRNKQRHGLEDYEVEALSSLHKNLKGKWDVISMQAEEYVRLAKERKKGDKIVSDSQERAYWRVHRPPPGQFTPLEPCPIPSRDRSGVKQKRKGLEDWERDKEYLLKSFNRTRIKMSQACEGLVNYWEIFLDYDFFIQPVLPSNPWVSEDISFWQLNNAIVDVPTEKRVKRWAISIEELVSDPTGLQEFTNFLEKEYSHENIRFWLEVIKLRRSAHSRVIEKVNEIYEEFLKPGAPCEINIDSKTMEIVQIGLQNPSRFTFDAAAEHIYMLLLKKDCYPRFTRSDHFKSLLATGIQPSHKKRFFNFGGAAKKKTSVLQNSLPIQTTTQTGVLTSGNLRRMGSERSLSDSAHELTITTIKDETNNVPHSHSQNNLMEFPHRESTNHVTLRLDSMPEAITNCPLDVGKNIESHQLSICPWEDENVQITKTEKTTSEKLEEMNISNDVVEISERLKKSCGLRQRTIDCDLGIKNLMSNFEQRRSSMTILNLAPESQTCKNFRTQKIINMSLTPSNLAELNEYQVSKVSFSLETDVNASYLKTQTEKQLENKNILQYNNNTDIRRADTIIIQDKFLVGGQHYEETSKSQDNVQMSDWLIVEDGSQTGCVAPAPTPAPLLAPLAETEGDTVEDENENRKKLKPELNESRKKAKKKNADSENVDKQAEKNRDDIKNDVCPWEDENLAASDGTYTKTYATLGYF